MIQRNTSALRRAAVEALESRQLLSFGAQVSFQPSSGTETLPAGWVIDSGSTYASRGNGFTYGWNSSNTSKMFDRDSDRSTDERYDTGAQMQASGGATTWEIAVPASGNYQVRIVAGDAADTDNVYKIKAEGTTIVDATPTTGTRWDEATGIVNVTDGKLTITNVSGSTDNRIAFVEIHDAGTITAAPGAPTNVRAIAASTTKVDVRWDPTSEGLSSEEALFKIERKTGSGGTWSQVGTALSNATYYYDSSLTAGSTYYYRVRANNINGDGSYSAETSVTLQSSSAQAPYNPTRAAWVVNGSPVTVQTEDFDIGGDGTSYDDSDTTNEGGGYRNTGVDVVAHPTEYNAYFVGWTRTGEWLEYTLDIQQAGTYQVQYRLADDDGGGTFHTTFGGTTKGGTVTVPQTGARTFTTVNTSTFSLSTGQQVMRIALDSPPSGSNVIGNADWFKLMPLVPSAPTGLSATGISASQINLAWTDASSNETGFKIEGSPAGANTWTQVATVGANVATYNVTTGLSASTAYDFRVRSYESGDSAYTATASATTLATIPTAPTSLSATVASPTSVNLAWTDNSSNETGFKIERSADAGSTRTLIQTTAAGAITYTDSTASDGASYLYRVKATNTGGDSSAATSSAVITPLITPTDLTATVISPTEVDLAWTDNTTHETGYKVERSTDAGSTWTVIQTTAASVTSFANATIADGTDYRYRVSAVNAVANSATAGPASATTPLIAPTSLTASVINAGEIDLAWADNTTHETGYKVERSTDAGSTWTVIQTTAASVTAFADTTAGDGTDCRYRVTAVNAITSSAASAMQSATTPLPAPSGLIATASSASQINLTWADNAAHETGYAIEISPADADTWTSAGTAAANATTFSVSSGLTAGAYYDFRVRATNSFTNSSYSPLATEVAEVIPAEPSGLTPTAASATEIDLTWADNSSNEQGFIVERSTTSGSGYAEIARVGPGEVTYADTGRKAQTHYYYRVWSYNDSGVSSTSTTADASTPTAPAPIVQPPADHSVVGRYVFYNDSAFDGNDTAANSSDDAAIATDKAALLPGQSATFANYTSFSKGINGIMIDVTGVPTGSTLTAADFDFVAGNTADPATWTAPATPTITMRRGAGVNGADRVELTWPDSDPGNPTTTAVRNQWLKVTMKGTANTQLTTDSAFYFGNAIGETGDNAANTIVDSGDYYGTRDHLRSYDNLAPVTWRWDINRDQVTDITDIMLVRANATGLGTPLQLLTVPIAAPDRVAAVPTAGTDAYVFWVDQSNDETGFTVFASSDAGATWQSVGTTAANTTGLYVTSLTTNTSYLFQVVANGPGGTAGSGSGAPNSAPAITAANVMTDADNQTALYKVSFTAGSYNGNPGYSGTNYSALANSHTGSLTVALSSVKADSPVEAVWRSITGSIDPHRDQYGPDANLIFPQIVGAAVVAGDPGAYRIRTNNPADGGGGFNQATMGGVTANGDGYHWAGYIGLEDLHGLGSPIDDADFNDRYWDVGVEKIKMDLDAMKVSHNVAAAELPDSEEDSVGAFLPLNDDDDNYTIGDPGNSTGADVHDTGQIVGENDLLPIILHKIPDLSSPGNYRLVIPTNVHVWKNKERVLEVTNDTPFSALEDTQLWVEGIDSGSSVLTVNWSNETDSIDNVDQLKLSVYTWSGPLNVPGYSIYNYKASQPLQESRWVTPIGGNFKAGEGTNDALILWGAGGDGFVGKAVYEVNDSYTWDLGLNIVKITPTTGTVAAPAGKAPTVHVDNTQPFVRISGPANITFATTVSVEGPNGGRGVKQMEIGWSQNLTSRAMNGIYSNNQVRTSSLEGNSYVDISPDVGATKPWYARGVANCFWAPVANGDHQFTANDRPNSLPLHTTFNDLVAGPLLQSGHIVEDFSMHLAVRTIDTRNAADKVYTSRAQVAWHIDYSGTVDAAHDYNPSAGNAITADATAFSIKYEGLTVPVTEGATANDATNTETWH